MCYINRLFPIYDLNHQQIQKQKIIKQNKKAPWYWLICKLLNICLSFLQGPPGFGPTSADSSAQVLGEVANSERTLPSVPGLNQQS